MKPIFSSKTFWINVISLLAMIIQAETGYVVPPEEQTMVLAIINIILRYYTGEPVR